MKKLALIFVSLFLLAGLAFAAAPTIDPINDQTITVGEAYSYQVVANDADNDVLTYSLTQSPSGMSIDASGLISWFPSASSTETVSVSVSDGVESVNEDFILTIQASNPEVTLSESSIQFGDNDADRGNTVVQTVTLTNTGNQDLTNIQATLVSNTGSALNADFNAQVSLGTTALSSGASTTVTMSLTIPLDQDSELRNIGRLSVSADGNSASTTATANVAMQAKSYLRIKDAEIEIDGDDENLDDGDNFDEIKEGDKVTITLEIENLYSDDDNIEIENVYFEIESDEDDWDIDEESDEQDIKEDDKEEFSVTFTLDDDLDEDETDVVIRVYGEDEEGNFEHYDELEFSFEIDRVKDEISIMSVNFEKTSYTCSDAYANLELKLKNTGTQDQDEVLVQVVIDELDWHERVRDIEMDEGDRETLDFKIPLGNIDETSYYFVEFEVYVDDGDEETDTQTESLTITCSSSDSGSNSGSSNSNTGSGATDNTVVVVTPPTNTGNTGSNGADTGNSNVVYGEPVGSLDGVRGTNLYMVLLIALIVLVLLGIFLLGGRLLNNN